MESRQRIFDRISLCLGWRKGCQSYMYFPVLVFLTIGKYKSLGLYQVFFKKIEFKFFFLVKIEAKFFEKFKKSNLCQNFKRKLYFWCQIQIYNVFSFYLMYILSIKIKNYEFSKMAMSKAEKFCCQIIIFQCHILKMLWNNS